MGRLDRKRCLVTGGASGIGRAIANAFVEQDAAVFITDINVERGRHVAASIGATFHRQDVADEGQWTETIVAATRRLGGLDVLVNNAGTSGEGQDGTPETTSLDVWRRIFQINAESIYLGCRAILPVLRNSGGGSIINLSSIAALIPTPFITAYGASKAAVLQLSQSVALHCANTGSKIRCNTIHPGQISTPMHDDLVRRTAENARIAIDEARQSFLSRIPLAEFGTPEDIASAAVYLASDESKHVTGQRIVVDGGMQLTN
jgi:3(or 17)beta-hydroxysteroid dehydrogenase